MQMREYHLYCLGHNDLTSIAIVLFGTGIQDAMARAQRVIKTIAPAGYSVFQLHSREKDNPDDYRLIQTFSASVETTVTVV